MDDAKLLIVDDDEIDRKIINRLLKQYNEIDEAYNCKECLVAVNKIKYDCIIVDYLLPDCNGLELIQAIKKAEIDVPIIATTGHGDEMLVVQMMRAGAYDYLPKDKITAELITRVVEGAIKYHKAEKNRIKAEADFKILYDSAPVGLWRTSISDGKFLSLNKYCKDILGFKDGIDIYANDLYKDKNRREELLIKLKENKEVKDFEIEIVLPDGTCKWISLVAKIYSDYLEGCLKDITKEKQLEQEIKRLQENFSNTLLSMKEDMENRLQKYQ